MTTYYSDLMKVTSPKPSPFPQAAGAVVKIRAIVAVPSTFTTTDTARMMNLPAGFRITGATIKADDLDSSTGITLNVGDSGSAARLFSASTVGQAATVGQASAATGVNYLTTAVTRIDIVPQAGASGTPAAGNIELNVEGIFEGIAS